jgi:uncharacterized protein YbaR (Trm112 family)
MSDDPIRTLATEICVLCNGTHRGELPTCPVCAAVREKLRQVQRETREAILGGIVVTCRACKLHYSLRETLESDGVCKHCGKLLVQIAAKWTR